jgi:hypothetical protein
VVSTASAASSSAQLGQDTYTPSSQSQAAQSSNSASTETSAQGTQGDTVTLASLIQNQTISGSADVRQLLLSNLDNTGYYAVTNAYNAVSTDVAAGDYSAAQKDLTNYTTALASLHYDTSLVANPVDALASALQSGNVDGIQAAYTVFNNDTPEGILGAGGLGFSGPGDAQNYAGRAQFVLPELTAQLQQLGYSAPKAAAEANAFVLGIVVDDADPQISTVGTPVTSTSNLSQVGGQISDLAKAAANSSGGSFLSSIIASLGKENTLTGIESTLTQLDIQDGAAAQSTATGSGNASQATASIQA